MLTNLVNIVLLKLNLTNLFKFFDNVSKSFKDRSVFRFPKVNVPQKGLLHEIGAQGIRRSMLSWIKDWLSH